MENSKNILIITISSLAVILFVPLFILRGIGVFDFWWWFTADIMILITIIAVLDRSFLSSIFDDFTKNIIPKIIIGLASVVLLYFVFYVGNLLSRMLMPFAGTEITDIYLFKGGISPLRIVLLMIFIIGPGEELLWRGSIQRLFMKKYGSITGFIITVALYTIVHAGSGNRMLLVSALVCSGFWGLIYLWRGSVLMTIISHTVWDIAVFIVFPFHKIL